MTWVSAAVVGGAAIVGAVGSNMVAKKAAKAQTDSSGSAIDFSRESRDLALGLQAPYRDASDAATAALMDLTGLKRPDKRTALTFDQWSAQNPDSVPAAATSKKKKKGLLGTLLNPAHSARAIVDPVGATINATKDVYGVFRAGGDGATGSATAQAGYKDYLDKFNATPDLGSYDKYNFQTDPGYQFRFDEGNKALSNSLVARGGALSGAAAKGALRYAQNYASNEYQNVYNRIASIAGFGQTATNASTGVIQQTGANVGNAMLNAGDARASSYIAQGNSWSNAINQIGMIYGNAGQRPVMGG